MKIKNTNLIQMESNYIDEVLNTGIYNEVKMTMCLICKTTYSILFKSILSPLDNSFYFNIRVQIYKRGYLYKCNNINKNNIIRCLEEIFDEKY